MKRALAVFAILLMLCTIILPSPAWAGGGFRHGGFHGGFHGHHGGWWWPGVFIGGLAVGAVALATAPFWAFAPPPPSPVFTTPAVVQVAPSQPAFAAPAAAPAPQQLPVPPPGSAPVASAPGQWSPPPAAQPGYAPSQTPGVRGDSPVRGEVVYEHGRYLLFGDGVRQPWQWVWVPATAPPPPPQPPR
jgi:hypothetical protein